MNSREPSVSGARSGPEETREGWTIFWLSLLGLFLGFVAVSNDSYWIDEASTLDKSIRPTVATWWERLRWEGTSNLQLPLYLLYAWGWEKLFGHGEWATRAANIPWLVVTMASFGWSFASVIRSRLVAASSLGLSAFVWFYANEARPYLMQLGAACVVFAALLGIWRAGCQASPTQERRWVWTLATGCLVLAASGMLAMLWLGGGLAAALFANPRPRVKELLVRYWPAASVTGIGLLAIGGYYLWTLTLGARATVIASTDLKSILFTVYEMIGMSGLGPGRLAIREDGLVAFKPYWAGLLLYGVLFAILWGMGWRRLLAISPKRVLLWAAIGGLSVLVFLILVGVTSRFRVLGRHCMPLLPVMVFPLGVGLALAWEKRGLVGRLTVTGFLCLSLISCLVLRFSERHAKDDYRGAAALAQAALRKGEKVWWNACDQAAWIYQLPLATGKAAPGEAVLIELPQKGFEAKLDLPDVVFTSKTDVYDYNGHLATFLQHSGFHEVSRLAAFSVWRRAGDSNQR